MLIKLKRICRASYRGSYAKVVKDEASKRADSGLEEHSVWRCLRFTCTGCYRYQNGQLKRVSSIKTQGPGDPPRCLASFWAD